MCLMPLAKLQDFLPAAAVAGWAPDQAPPTPRAQDRRYPSFPLPPNPCLRWAGAISAGRGTYSVTVPDLGQKGCRIVMAATLVRLCRMPPVETPAPGLPHADPYRGPVIAAGVSLPRCFP